MLYIIWAVVAFFALIYIAWRILLQHSQDKVLSEHAQGARRTFHTKVAGVTMKNSDGRRRQEIIRSSIVPGVPVSLVREPDNRRDPNAIKVVSQRGEQIGYIPEDVAFRMADEMDAGAKYTAMVANITGGTTDKPTRGVNLQIAIRD